MQQVAWRLAAKKKEESLTCKTSWGAALPLPSSLVFL